MTQQPLVSVGVPVYNGEEFLEEVLESIVTQTYPNLEIIVCDNASTDGTPDIAKRFVARDTRVQYHRNSENIGASPNHNRVFDLSNGEFFEWASADNVLTPTYIERCVDVLVANPQFVLAHSRCTIIDEFRGEERRHEAEYNLGSPDAIERLHQLFTHTIGMNDPIFGIIRSSVLRQTHLLKSYIGADDGLLVELALKGPFGFVPDYLIRLRSHPGAYHAIKKKKVDLTEDSDEAVWFDSSNRRKRLVFPHWRRMREYSLVVCQSEHSVASKLRMLAFMGRVAAWRRDILFREFREALVPNRSTRASA
jgi:glycosyltransferase involved in cell wall biosynthesis